jgi:16S rRNA processing protein RimM
VGRVDDERVLVGRVGRPHGLHGAFVVDDASDTPDRFSVGRELIAGGERVRVEESKRAGGRLVVRLDRPVPRGTRLEVLRGELPPPEEDSYYVFQLVGLDVVEDGGRPLGRVRDVESGVANDVLVLDAGDALPLVEDCVLEIDLDARRIVVARGFAAPG